MIEKHYTIRELAAVLSMSLEKARLLIKDEPGVLKFPSDSTGKAARRTMNAAKRSYQPAGPSEFQGSIQGYAMATPTRDGLPSGASGRSLWIRW